MALGDFMSIEELGWANPGNVIAYQSDRSAIFGRLCTTQWLLVCVSFNLPRV